MYSWYWNAEICYVYMRLQNATNAESSFKTNRWFTRGWTLQELLAPNVVEFYDHDWNLIGTKCNLVSLIEHATGIRAQYLHDRALIREANVGTKFSWASRRQTSRSEDIAYHLLGLLDVNMPMLYGEGTRAFYRLQLEILRQSTDHTIFAWQPGLFDDDGYDITGFLAPSPAYFRSTVNIEIQKFTQQSQVQVASTHEITNLGLRISLLLIPYSTDTYLGLLNCRKRNSGYVAILLQSTADDAGLICPPFTSSIRRRTKEFKHKPYISWLNLV